MRAAPFVVRLSAISLCFFGAGAGKIKKTIDMNQIHQIPMVGFSSVKYDQNFCVFFQMKQGVRTQN